MKQILRCVPTNKSINHPDRTVKELPQIKALWTTHIGAYESLNVAYKAIFDYAQKYNIKCAIPTREIYVKGPGLIFKGNPNKKRNRDNNSNRIIKNCKKHISKGEKISFNLYPK